MKPDEYIKCLTEEVFKILCIDNEHVERQLAGEKGEEAFLVLSLKSKVMSLALNAALPSRMGVVQQSHDYKRQICEEIQTIGNKLYTYDLNYFTSTAKPVWIDDPNGTVLIQNIFKRAQENTMDLSAIGFEKGL